MRVLHLRGGAGSGSSALASARRAWKAVDNPFLRCIRVSGSGPGLPTFPQPYPASALGPRSVIRFAPPRADGIRTRRWRLPRACGRRRRRPCAASPPSAADRRRPSSPCCESRRQARLGTKLAGVPGAIRRSSASRASVSCPSRSAPAPRGRRPALWRSG